MGKRLNKAVGVQGEISAEDYLKKQKYKILELNYVCKLGEIDIIAVDKKSSTIVFVEVKRRHTLAFGRPSEAVNLHKQAKIRRAAEEFLIRNHLLDSLVRFDVIDILDEELNHINLG